MTDLQSEINYCIRQIDEALATIDSLGEKIEALTSERCVALGKLEAFQYMHNALIEKMEEQEDKDDATC